VGALVALASVAARAATEGHGASATFHGEITPLTLPRDRPAPARLHLGFKLQKTGDVSPTPLSELAFELDPRIAIDFRGTPFCPLQVVRREPIYRAVERCGDAQVGRGHATYRVTFPGQGEFGMQASLAAFNGRHEGRPAIFVARDFFAKIGDREHVFVFELERKGNRSRGISLAAKEPPPFAGSSGWVSSFDLTLERNYTVDGRKRGYVSATCPLPAETRVGVRRIARVSFLLEDGSEYFSVLQGRCRARA
jgi:hypothetical protein